MNRLIMASILMSAAITGSWIAEVETEMGSGTPTFDFKQAGEPLSGMVKGNDVEFSLTIDAGGQTAKVVYKEQAEGGAMSGPVVFVDLAEGKWKAKKS